MKNLLDAKSISLAEAADAQVASIGDLAGYSVLLDGTKSQHSLQFKTGARLLVAYEAGEPISFTAEGIRFFGSGNEIFVMPDTLPA